METLSRRAFIKVCAHLSCVGGLSLLAAACDVDLPTGTPDEGAKATSAAPTSVPATAAAGPSPSAPAPTATAPVLAEGERLLAGAADVEQIAQLTGEGSINETAEKWGVFGTDLGSMFDKDDKLYMVFGDSFGCCIPGTGGPGNARDWRKNLMAVISDRDPGDGLVFDEMISDEPGHAKELLARGRFDVTVIPTNGIAVGSRMYLHYMAVLAWGEPGEWVLNESGLAYSDDDGQTWTKDENLKWDGKSNFGQVAFVKSDSDLYLFGIPGGRFGGVKLARVSQDAVLDKAAYQYFSGVVDGQPQWSPDESAGALIASAPVGELSVMWNAFLGRWIMTYLDESRAAIVIREAAELWGPWSPPMSLVAGGRFPGLYGAYLHPWFVENEGETIYFTMSQWGPYNVFWMKARLVKA
jgi:hypothetical protein